MTANSPFMAAMIERQRQRLAVLKAHAKNAKPRNFTAMRDDRVTAMAERRFGKAFASAGDARAALAALPVAEQHALKKPMAPSRIPAAERFGSQKGNAMAETTKGIIAKSTASRPRVADLVRAKDEAGLRAILNTNGVKVPAVASMSTLRAAAAATTYQRLANRMAAGGSDARAASYQRAAARFEAIVRQGITQTSRQNLAAQHSAAQAKEQSRRAARDAMISGTAKPAKATAAKPKGGPIGFQNKDTLNGALKAKGASEAGKAKAPTKAQARKAAAVKAYEQTFGGKPSARMSAPKIEAEVRRREIDKSRIAQQDKMMDRLLVGDRGRSSLTDVAGLKTSAMGAKRQDIPKAVPPLAPHERRTITAAVSDLRQAVANLPKGPPPAAPPAPPAGPTIAQRARATASAAMPYVGTVVGVAGVGAAAGRGYHEARAAGKTKGEAAIEGAKSAAVPAAIMAAPAIEKGARSLSQFGFGAAKVAVQIAAESPLLMMTGGAPVIGGVAAGGAAVGVAAKALEIGAKVVGRVALPAMAAYSAFQGAKEDKENMTRGAARGAVRAFDPTAIFMQRGLAERGFDSVFGRSPAPAGTPGGTGSWGPQAYLNSSASTKALSVASPMAMGQIGATPRQAGAPRTDGMTAAYSRVDPRTGKVVDVKAYSTPARG